MSEHDATGRGIIPEPLRPYTSPLDIYRDDAAMWTGSRPLNAEQRRLLAIWHEARDALREERP